MPIPNESGRDGREVPTAAVQVPPIQPEPEVIVASILYSSERQLAIIDGRIAGVGDRVGTSRVVAILPRSVVLESPTGERHTVELHAQLTRERAR
jgi:hypothetical protein